MRVILTSEARFQRTSDGRVWSQAAYGATLWQRYLEVFEGVVVVARVADVGSPSQGYVVASSDAISFCGLPSYQGLLGALGAVRVVTATADEVVQAGGAVILRSPSAIATRLFEACCRARQPFGVEVVGDPAQVFARGAFHHPLRPLIRIAASRSHRQICLHAAAAHYVTQGVLQRMYPCLGATYAGSDVALDDEAFASERSAPEIAAGRAIRIVTVTTLDQPYKGVAFLLNAAAMVRSRVPITLNVVGGGRLLPALRQLAQRLGLSSVVSFAGQLDTAGVRAALDAADLFILPSLTEGLPRALLEAMARGLPAIATAVGGIPELLPADCLVRPGDAKALETAILRFVASPLRLQREGVRNLSVAGDFRDHLQAPERRRFFEHVRRSTETWRGSLQRHPGAGINAVTQVDHRAC